MPFDVAIQKKGVERLLAYNSYRSINFFGKEQLITPLGIERSEYKTFECDGIKMNTPVDGKYFGITPIPCTDLECGEFSPRGIETRDGFNAK